MRKFTFRFPEKSNLFEFSKSYLNNEAVRVSNLLEQPGLFSFSLSFWSNDYYV